VDETHYLWMLALVLELGQVEGQEQLPALLESLNLVLHQHDSWWLAFWLTSG
jgi:hypothetical protein